MESTVTRSIRRLGVKLSFKGQTHVGVRNNVFQPLTMPCVYFSHVRCKKKMSEVMPETDTGSIFIAGILVVQRTTSCCIVAERGVGSAMLSPAIKHCV